jgi:hypothetical protein
LICWYFSQKSASMRWPTWFFRKLAPVAVELARARVVRRVGGAREIVGILAHLVLALLDRVVDQVVVQDLAARERVVLGAHAQLLHVVEAAPHVRVHLHDADRADRRRQRRHRVALAYELAPAALLPRGGEHEVAEQLGVASREHFLALRAQRRGPSRSPTRGR